jgi:hypothetical protein
MPNLYTSVLRLISDVSHTAPEWKHNGFIASNPDEKAKNIYQLQSLNLLIFFLK